MRSWKPRRWPLSPSLALEYACVDARPLARLERLPSLIGLRVTGHHVPLSSRGLALVDLTMRAPAPGSIVLARLPQRTAQVVGFAGPAIVARHYKPEPEGVVLWPFSAGRGQPISRSWSRTAGGSHAERMPVGGPVLPSVACLARVRGLVLSWAGDVG